MKTHSVSRRGFVSALPLTVLAATESFSPAYPWRPEETSTASTDRPAGMRTDRPGQGQVPGFSGPFTEAEAAAVAASPLAQDIAALHGQGYPCSEMMLLASLQRFGLPENHLDAAAVFGGGVGKRDLCGFLTGGLMAIGLLAGQKYGDRAEVHRVGRAASNAYWDWWLTRGDLHCMGPGTTHETPEEFLRMSQRAALKLEEVLLAV